jgi:3-hydroxyisobutyrate dehydrogenase
VPLGEAAEKVYVDAVKRYPELSRKDFSSVYRYLEKEKR